MTKLGDRASQCAIEAHYDGFFPVAVTLDSDGAVTAVDKPAAFEGTLDPRILSCVSTLIRALRFAKAPAGRTLSHAFELHAR